MEPSYSLPFELLDLIIDNVDPSSRAGQSILKVCNLANQTLHSICQRRLFEEVSLTYKLGHVEGGTVLYDDERTTGHKFLNLINTSPHICTYVKKLSIDELPREAMLPSDPSRRSWNASDSATFSLYAIISQCKALEAFVPRCYFDWNPSRRFIEERTQAFFLQLVRRVKEVDFRTLQYFPITAFSGCHNLERLHITSLGEAEGHNHGTPSPEAKQVHLLSLVLNDVTEDEAVSWFDSSFSPLNISRLHSLTISLKRRNIPAMEKVVALSSENLENLDLRMNLYLETMLTTPVISLGLHPLHSLRNLNIRVHVGHFMYRKPPRVVSGTNGGGIHVNDFSYIASTLETLPFIEDPQRKLHVNISLGVSDFKTFEKQFVNIPWTDLIDVLNEEATSLRITKVNLLIVPFENGTPLAVPMRTVTSVLDRNEGLGRLRRKGFISYRCI